MSSVPSRTISKRLIAYFVLAVTLTCFLVGWGFAEIKGDQHRQDLQSRRLERVIQQQAQDRETAILKNISARKSDCESGDKIRQALRENVIQGEKQLPLILKLLPSLNTKQILILNRQTTDRQLKAFSPINCTNYAMEAAPQFERHKLSLAEQQAELKKTESDLHELVLKGAETRINTVSQRCELTHLIAEVLIKQDPQASHPFIASLERCHKQLKEVEKIVANARKSP